jgi:4-diphosphocytidyl-2-C-methyl-D-erythritol kinase
VSFTARPPAKVNLDLKVLGRRDDGFHELASTFVRVALCDVLTMRIGDSADNRLTVTGLPGVPVQGNLVLRAVEAVRVRAGVPLPGLEIELEKRIPAAAGLGGGSSDCASAIEVAQACWGIGLSPPEELELGAQLGSDVPFFVSGCRAARVEGRGEVVVPAEVAVSALVLVTPPVGLSTAAVFARFDELGSPGDPSNDLWPAAASLEPSLRELREALNDASGREWRMSGSGPTLFALYPSVDAAVTGARSLVDDHPSTFANCVVHAVDVDGDDPAWRFP